MKKIAYLLSCVMLLAATAGCSSDTVPSGDTQTETDLAAAFDEDTSLLKESSGTIGCGYPDAPDEGFVYDGTEVRFTYYVENMGEEEESDAEVGLLFFVDGEVQPFAVDEGDALTEEAVMQEFTLAPGEKREFEVVFQPVSGKEGDVVGIIPAVIWNPHYVPERAETVRFGNCYKMTTNIPLAITMEADGTGEHRASSLQCDVGEIPEEILLQLEGTYASDSYDILDNMVTVEIETANDSHVIALEDGKLDVTINLYGGKQVADKITLFIGNEPVMIEDGDYVEVNTEKGKMCRVQASIDVADLQEDSVMYAFVMTAGEDYVVQDIYMTDPVLVTADNGGADAEGE